MGSLNRLGVKLLIDGADFESILALYKNPLIKGFTTNASLMRKAGINEYQSFARRLLAVVPDRPISFEVFADEPNDMIRQGGIVASWGKNANVKIPGDEHITGIRRAVGRRHDDQCDGCNDLDPAPAHYCLSGDGYILRQSRGPLTIDEFFPARQSVSYSVPLTLALARGIDNWGDDAIPDRITVSGIVSGSELS